MRTSNPVFRSIERSYAYSSAEAATYGGIVSKTALLLGLAAITGILSILYIPVETLYSMMFVAMIVALISVLVASRSPRLAMPFALLYGVAEGLLLGVITAIFEIMVPGIAFTAILATGVIFLVMLFLYSSRTIRVTNRFRKIMFGTLISFLVLFILFGILSMFGGSFVTSVLADPGIMLLVGGVMIIFGALMLTLDFDRAEMIVEGGADKSYEWVVSLGLMVTIVWIYIELLRFIFILTASRNR